MTRALIDVSVLVALFDPDHVFSESAHAWLGSHDPARIATCPITENGLIRILSNPRYSATLQCSPGDIQRRLASFCRHHDHEFWADDQSLREDSRFRFRHILRHRQLTDIYLLSLAAARGSALVTFDTAIPLEAVSGATSDHLLVL